MKDARSGQKGEERRERGEELRRLRSPFSLLPSPFPFRSCWSLSVAMLVTLCLAGTAAADDDLHLKLDLWPLLRIASSADGSRHNLEALWPIIEWRVSPEERQFYFRPLYNRRDDRQSRVVESEWLYPIGFGTHRPDLSRRVLFPLALREKERISDGTERRRNIILPFLYQRSGKGPGDFLLFPFGGVIHDVLGREKAVIVLWPLFVYQRGPEVSSWSFLHPIFSRIRWDDGGRGFKAWPLFGLNRRPGRMLKLFVLWPVVHYQRMTLAGGELRRVWAFPFYGRIESPGGWEWAVLWPFFSHRVDRNVGQEDWWYPWPFLGRRSGLDESEAGRETNADGWTFWPLFSTDRRPGTRTAQFLWPLGWYRRSEREGEKAVSLRVVPLMFRQREEGKAGRSGAWQLWPLLKYRYGADGWGEAEFPSVMPMRYHGGWERNFAPFFRVFGYHRSKGGTRSWRLLWRLVRVDSGPSDRFVEVAPVFKIQTRSADQRKLRWSFLKGLLGYERVGDSRRWRFLYLLRVGKEPRPEPEERTAE